VQQSTTELPDSLSSEDSHKFAKQLLREAMQEAQVSNENMEQVIVYPYKSFFLSIALFRF